MIRRAQPNDAHALGRLYNQLVESAFTKVLPERLEELQHDPTHYLLVGEYEGAVIASALLIFCKDAMFGFQPFAVVENIIVDEVKRGAGIGKQLIRAIEQLCMGQDCSKIMLLSSTHRTQAHAFFERAGFKGDSKRGFVKYRRDLMATT
ncbi:GNAT family N-acetyltransferase [Pseudomonas asuensis]|uniref:N-acetyltransferase domain-containing protein n=1 Tax=Pseudomonas asuensis TaxID=1825787 RepID=A0ABQ2GY05_9PSED|nr:GNAT family N-acetyltransferase [Pseudomonas asuensis]GGM17374.1 hypothetical protein GCM10009425_30470 [Pseudomonas asuensis]